MTMHLRGTLEERAPALRTELLLDTASSTSALQCDFALSSCTSMNAI